MGSLNERLGEVIKRKRQRDRLTQTDLGGKIGVSGSYISSLELASSSARITEIEGLAAVFRTTAFALLSEAAQADTNDFSVRNRERNEFLTLYDALEGPHQEQVRLFLLFLREQQDRAAEHG